MKSTSALYSLGLGLLSAVVGACTADVEGMDNNAVDAPIEAAARPLAVAAGAYANVYMIVTTDTLYTNATQMDSFTTAKRNMGYNVWAATETKTYYNGSLAANTGWGGGKGQEAAKKIKNFLKKYSDIQHLFLIGDPRTADGDVPMFAFKPYKYGTCLQYDANKKCIQYKATEDRQSDIYLADNTSDFESIKDKDGDYVYITELGNQLSTNVGRLPVYNSDTSFVNAYLDKVVKYHASTDTSWRTKVLLAAHAMNTDPKSGSYNYGITGTEAIRTDTLAPFNAPYYRMYQSADPNVVSESQNQCSYDLVTAELNNKYGLFVYNTHGAAGEGTVVASGVIRPSDAAKLDDNFPAIIYGASCTNANIRATKNLPHSLLQNGAIAFIGATHVTNPSAIDEEFVKELLINAKAAGVAFKDAKNTVKPTQVLKRESEEGTYFPDTRWNNYVAFNYFGDPSVGLYTYSNGQEYTLRLNGINLFTATMTRADAGRHCDHYYKNIFSGTTRPAVACLLDGEKFGYELFWDSKRVGHNASWTEAGATYNCNWNAKTYRDKKTVACKYDNVNFAEKTYKFIAPKIGSLRLDYCKAWGQDCGYDAADAYCESQGYKYAKQMAKAPDVGPTKLITGATCNQAACDGFAYIVCGKMGL